MKLDFKTDTSFDLSDYKNSKKVLVFLSGGCDSLYLLLQDLLCGYTVVATYVEIKNNRDKVKRELAALRFLQDDIKKFCDYFKCKPPLFYGTQSIHILGQSFGLCAAPQQVIFAMFTLLLGHGFDEVQMGIVQGDSMCENKFNGDIALAYQKNFYSKGFPHITYPLEQVSKEAEYITLKGYDELLGTHFIEHLTCCESVDKPCGKDKKCLPCQTQNAVFKRLKWVK